MLLHGAGSDIDWTFLRVKTIFSRSAMRFVRCARTADIMDLSVPRRTERIMHCYVPDCFTAPWADKENYPWPHYSQPLEGLRLHEQSIMYPANGRP
jgi:hypothetical protein